MFGISGEILETNTMPRNVPIVPRTPHFLRPYVPQTYHSRDELWPTINTSVLRTRGSSGHLRLPRNSRCTARSPLAQGRDVERRREATGGTPRLEKTSLDMFIRETTDHLSVILTKNSARVLDHSYGRARDVVARPSCVSVTSLVSRSPFNLSL